MATALLIKCENFQLLTLARRNHEVVKFVTAKLYASLSKFSVLSINEIFLKIG